MRKVTTQFVSDASGRSKILAKSGGRQLTTPVDLSQSSDWNHGTAAGALLHQKWNFGAGDVSLPMTHESSDDGCRHTFTIGE